MATFHKFFTGLHDSLISQTLYIHTYLTGKQIWSRRGFFQGEAIALQFALADPCDYRKRR